ncbi:MAG: DNA topoisomerase [Nitrosopumilaceae archaeon]
MQQKNSYQIIVSNVKPDDPRNYVKLTKRKITSLKNEMRQYYDTKGYLSWSAKKKKYVILGTNSPSNGLVECPQCHKGKLMVIRSRTTKKRFIGCSNYHNGCKASTPLIQRGMIRTTKTPCELCKWPMILVRYSRRQKWARQCANINCKTRKP